MIIKKWEEGKIGEISVVKGHNVLVRKEELGLRDLVYIMMTIITIYYICEN